MNHTQIFGYLVADPEERFTSGGQKVTTLRIADNQKRKGQEETIWWRGSLWGDHPLLSYLKKGSAVIIMGEMKKPEIYNNREGQPQVSLDITVSDIRFSPFGRPRDEAGGNASQNGQSFGGGSSSGIESESGFGGEMTTAGAGASMDISNDDVPF